MTGTLLITALSVYYFLPKHSDALHYKQDNKEDNLKLFTPTVEPP